MTKYKLLIIDDEMVVQQSCIDIFSEKSERYNVHTASSGDEALKILEDESFDVVLTDLKMPGLPGLDLVRELRQRFPGLVVVVITGYSTVQTAVETMKLGADDFIPKPFTPDELLTAIDRAMDKAGK